MPAQLRLASTSPIRLSLLRGVGLDPLVTPPRVDEEMIRAAAAGDGLPPRDQADLLAETKAIKVSAAHPADLVLGADQILELDGAVIAKPGDRKEAAHALLRLSGQTHRLHTAAVLARDGRPVWRHLLTARMTMHPLTEAQISAYLNRIGDEATQTPGSYRIEGPGLRLFARIEGDHFGILGLPLFQLIQHLSITGDLPP